MHVRLASLLVTVLVSLAAAAAPAGAQADDPVTRAAESLRSDPLYVDPGAERALSEQEAARLREQIRDSGAPVFVAVMPASAGQPDEVVRRVAEEVGLSGTYAVVAGDSFRAGSTDRADADELATAAFQAASEGGTAAVLSRFVDEVAASPSGADGDGTGAGPLTADRDRGGDEGDGIPGPLVIGGLVAGGAGLLVWSRRRRRREAEAAEERRARVATEALMLRAEMDVLANDILRMEDEVVLHPEARDDYEAAAERHRLASAALEYADEPVDLVRVERVVSEARYAMARAKALVEGRQPPPPPDELRRPGRHQEPPLDVDEEGMPVYAGGQPFYGGGWFGGAGGGLFGGLLLGSMLGGPFGWGGWGWGGPIVIQDDDGGDGGWGDGGGGDAGDWGGGDFGGGDFGGGDFGGGDF